MLHATAIKRAKSLASPLTELKIVLMSFEGLDIEAVGLKAVLAE